MHLQTLVLAPLVATGLASAIPYSNPEPKAVVFEALALRSATDIHFSSIQAAKSNIFLQLPHQKAVCEHRSDNAATFKLVGGELFLYREAGPHQQLYVDRSGMGQGKLGYTTGSQSAPRNAERKGWKIEKGGILGFKGNSFVACPHSIDNSWSVWIYNGIKNPGGNKGCLDFIAQTATIKDPNSCKYTQ
ncbi:hypothetical protein AK830_g1179 [Neonectria ditissima]|uniref:Cell wall protein PhiA n=1 Tax=Neonectria ditissima TaxID=78410 RepID=A0A0P7BVA3_9HYPO|nr:hypothetical protein AK830_g1179 [Neonectria ditissima]